MGSFGQQADPALGYCQVNSEEVKPNEGSLGSWQHALL